jgi:excisionase family DNA binding protein
MKQILEVRLYNVPEAATLLGVTSQTVRKYIKKKKLQAQKIGRSLFVTEENLKTFLSGTTGAVNDSRQ